MKGRGKGTAAMIGGGVALGLTGEDEGVGTDAFVGMALAWLAERPCQTPTPALFTAADCLDCVWGEVTFEIPFANSKL